MSLRAYLPSTQFAVIVVSLVLSGGLVFAAQYVTHQPQGSLTSATTPGLAEDWQTQLDEIQAQTGVAVPETPDDAAVGTVLAQAKTDNLTQTVARSLLITLTNAKAQGLGDDIPTQDQLVAQALAQTATTTPRSYTAADLAVGAQTDSTLHDYGNKVMAAFVTYPGASFDGVINAVGYATDYNDAARLAPAATAALQYKALARALVRVPVPSTIAPLHLTIVNDLAAMGNDALDIQQVLSDPVRGLAGIQRFSAEGNEVARVLTTIAGVLNKNGILFTKDEPGKTWAAFSSSAQTQ